MLKPWSTPGEINRTLPRADPADVQKVVDKWKEKNKIEGPSNDATRGRFRTFCYFACQHFFAPHDVFDQRSWSVEDVRVCLAELEKA